jgi:predicted nucleic acid-binding protein
MLTNYSHVVLDTCCILNFCASGHLIEILKSIPAQVVVTEVVKSRELLTLKRVEENSEISAITFEGAIGQGLISIEDFRSEAEENAFINYASELKDDGESATFAIAANRNWAVATDDQKATSFFKREFPQIQLLSSLDILKNYADEAQLAPAELEALLRGVRTRGRYVPNRKHPLAAWWEVSINLN